MLLLNTQAQQSLFDELVSVRSKTYSRKSKVLEGDIGSDNWKWWSAAGLILFFFYKDDYTLRTMSKSRLLKALAPVSSFLFVVPGERTESSQGEFVTSILGLVSSGVLSCLIPRVCPTTHLLHTRTYPYLGIHKDPAFFFSKVCSTSMFQKVKGSEKKGTGKWERNNGREACVLSLTFLLPRNKTIV